MLAFTNTEVSKPQLIASLEAHAAADRIVAGQYWEDGLGGTIGGCAVGCSIHDFRPGDEGQHSLYEPLFGIPQIIARLEDSIFERLPQPQQKEWPLRFARAVREGADLSRVWDRFALWMLINPIDGVVKHAKREQTRKSIEAVSALYRRKCDGDEPSRKEWQASAADAASSAADAASSSASAAYAASAADADAYAASAADAAASAADAAASSSASAAYADAAASSSASAAYAAYAASAADADAYAAYAASAADAAAYADAYAAYAAYQKAKHEATIRQADKLIELIEAC